MRAKGLLVRREVHGVAVYEATQPKVAVIVMAIGLASWPVIARLVRAEFRSLRESEFVLAARSQGFSDLRIIFQEILPNALPPVIVTASVLVATAILIESALAFVGYALIAWQVGDHTLASVALTPAAASCCAPPPCR